MEKKVEDCLLERLNMKTYLYTQVRKKETEGMILGWIYGNFYKTLPFQKLKNMKDFILSYDYNFILTVFGVCFTLLP